MTADTAVYHQGPVTFYMTKVQDAVAADGSTDWFKIKEIGPTFSNGQATWDLSSMFDFTIIRFKLTDPVQSHTLLPYLRVLPPESTCSASNSSASTTQAELLSSTLAALS